MSITHEQMKRMQGLRQHLTGTGMFCFEKNGKFFLYREVKEGRNTLILVRSNFDAFMREANKQLPKDGS